MLSILFISLAAIFKAVADTTQDHFAISIFKNYNPKFWDKNTSWQYATHIFNYPVDAWHLSNSAMIVCFCSAVTLRDQIFNVHLKWYLQLGLYGVAFIVVFNLFYNHILKRKT